MMPFDNLERTACATELLRNMLTERERDLVVGFALGRSPQDVARRWKVTPTVINRMMSVIRRKADRYWA